MQQHKHTFSLSDMDASNSINHLHRLNVCQPLVFTSNPNITIQASLLIFLFDILQFFQHNCKIVFKNLSSHMIDQFHLFQIKFLLLPPVNITRALTAMSLPRFVNDSFFSITITSVPNNAKLMDTCLAMGRHVTSALRFVFFLWNVHVRHPQLENILPQRWQMLANWHTWYVASPVQDPYYLGAVQRSAEVRLSKC